MNGAADQRRAMHSWLFVGALSLLSGVLGFLQYRWIGEVSVAARERLRGSLQASLAHLSQDFNAEITAACRALLPAGMPHDAQAAEEELSSRYEQWNRTARPGRVFRRIAIAEARKDAVLLRSLNLETGVFETAEWPAAWEAIKDRLESRLSPEPRQGRNPPGAPPAAGPPREQEGVVFEVPLWMPAPERTAPAPFGRRPGAWLIFDFNLQYLRDVLLPEVVQRHLEAGGNLDYQVEVVTRTSPPWVVYQSDPGEAKRIALSADASVSLLELQYDQIFRRWAPPFPRLGGPGPGRVRGPGAGRWEMFVRHRAGSLEAVVSRARWRNLAVTAGVFLLMAAAVAALIRYTRRAQKLAQLQMEFVAGVSHELRTPLTVIHGAAYNLRGSLARNPAQVERYGALIQQESGRLKELVEQVLRFAGAESGRVIQQPEPLSVETVIEEALDSMQGLIQGGRCTLEKNIEPGLPPVLGDPVSLKLALQNLLGNAAKYGTKGSGWIGVFASRAGGGRAAIEIRVADHGPGIPEDEQERIFDPFFRGRRAVEDQVHGTGLGLNLVKKIVEAHGGTIRVKSAPMQGAEFIVRIPVAGDGAAG